MRNTMRPLSFCLPLLVLVMLALFGCSMPKAERVTSIIATARSKNGGLSMEVVRPVSLKGVTFLLLPVESRAIEQMAGKTWLVQLRDKEVVDLLKLAEYLRGYQEHVRSGDDPLAYDGYSPLHFRLSELAAPPSQIDPPSREISPSSPPKN
jgi:hypothetical protein